MTLPIAKWAVYSGTIKLKDGTTETYTAAEVAALYGIEDETYIDVPLAGPSPFLNAPDELSYIHLKPLPDMNYYDALKAYNTDYETVWDEDFDAHRGGKWAVRPIGESNEDI